MTDLEYDYAIGIAKNNLEVSKKHEPYSNARYELLIDARNEIIALIDDLVRKGVERGRREGDR